MAVDAWFVPSSQGTVAGLRVLAPRQPTSTSDGRLLIRHLPVDELGRDLDVDPGRDNRVPFGDPL
jgi:hypothetical protein